MLKTIANFLVNLTGECAGDMGVKQNSPSDVLHKQMMNCHSVCDLLPYVSYDEQYQLFVNKNSCGFILEATPLIGFTGKSHNNIASIFKSLLPKGSNIQFLFIGGHKIGHVLSNWSNARNINDGVINALTKRRMKFFEELAKHKSQVKDFRILISYSTKFKKSLSDFEKKEISNLKQKLKTIFESSSLYTYPLTPLELFLYLDFFLKPNKSLAFPEYTWNKYQDISSQFGNINVSIQPTPNELIFNEGEFVMRTYTVKKFPDFWIESSMGKLIGDEFSTLMQLKSPFFFHFGINICDDSALQNKLTAKSVDISAKAGSPLAKWLPALVDEAREWSFVREQMTANERLVRTHFSVGIISDFENISECEGDLMSIFNSNKWNLERDKFTQMPSLLSAMPMMWGEGMHVDMTHFKKTRITLSHEPTNLLPLQGEWKGTKNPLMMFIGRRGQISQWNPYDGENYNVSIVGGSGSGKSVFM